MNVNAGAGIQQSALLSTFNIDKPEVLSLLLGPYGDQGLSEFDMMEMLGYTRPVAQTYTTQYEEDFISQSVHTNGAITSLGGNQYSFVLGTVSPNNDFLASSSTAPYSTPYYVTPIRPKDRVAFQGPDGPVLFQVLTVSGSYPTVTVTIQQVDTSKSFTAGDYASGTEVIIPDNAHSEGSGQPQGLVNKPYIDHAYLQILKENFTTTGTQMATQSWVTAAEFGGQLLGYFIKGQKDAEYRMKKAAFNAMMFGQLPTTGIIDSTTNEPFLSTEGHISYAQRRGINLPYVAGTWAPTSLDSINKQLDSLWAPKEYVCFRGIDLANEQDNALKSYFQFTNIDYVTDYMRQTVFGGDEGKAAAVNFTYLKKGDRNFAFKKVQAFNDRKTWGATGWKTPGLGWYAPLGRIKDKKTGEDRPFFGMLYMEHGGYSRKAEIWTLAGAGPVGQKVLAEDVNQLQLRMHVGAEHYGGQLMVLTPQA